MSRWEYPPIDDPTPVTVAPGTLLERYLRTIDLCNDSQLIKDESGLWKITGGPTEGALKVLAAKVTLPPLTSELRSKILLIRNINTCRRSTGWVKRR
jgi:magnesium-transporting ATPase (P-type)